MAGPRAYANPGLHRGAAGKIRGCSVPSGSGKPSRLLAHSRTGYRACEGFRDHGGLALDRRNMLGFLVGVRYDNLALVLEIIAQPYALFCLSSLLFFIFLDKP